MSLDLSTPDPKTAIRQARMDALKPQVSRDAVIAALQQLVLDVTFERTNALTQAVDDLMRQHPKDHWDLDGAREVSPLPLSSGGRPRLCPAGG
jgi:hypothetical protein